jgi:AraC-like DNA-binding protein/mannose-6-phosphate isomerase-like protein (cupin superfamily)
MKQEHTNTDQKASLQVILPEPESSFAYLVHPWPWPQCVWHYHPEYELHYILNAEGQVWVGDYIGPFESHHLVLVGPNLPHNWTSNSLSMPGRPPQEDHVVHFLPGTFGKGFLDIPETRAIRRLLARAATGLEFTGPVRITAGEMILRLGQCQGFARLLAFLALLDCLARCEEEAHVLSSPTYAPVLSEDTVSRLNQALVFVRANLAEDISLVDAAEAAHMSQRAFSRFFWRTTGRHFLDYLAEMRIGQACNLLQNTDEPITDICFTVGFGNIAWFNRKFIAIKGMTPRQFRQKSEARHGPFGNRAAAAAEALSAAAAK